jgi:hypothetical protein
MTTGGNWWRRYESSIIRSAYSHLLPGHPVIRTRPFEQLLDFIRRTSEEEQRAAREGLDEEELAIFDLLTKPEPTLTKAQEVNVKAIARPRRRAERPASPGGRATATRNGNILPQTAFRPLRR